jgi:membrane fusion protein (multidrug efflux system)
MELDPLRLELTVAETEVAAISPGREVQFQVVAYPGEVFRGRVKYVGPAVRRASRDLVAEAVVPNGSGKLRPGMFATVRIEAGQVAVPMVPATALRSGDSGNADRLFVVSGDRLEERVVQVGDRHGDELTILAGVRAGERVVTRLSSEVRDGVRVSLAAARASVETR